MPDGTVKTASGLKGANTSNMQTFATKDAAMEFYRPAPQAPQPGPTAIAQPVKPAPAQAAPAAPAQPATQQAPAPQDPTAARTTSPTAKLEMKASDLDAGLPPGSPTPTGCSPERCSRSRHANPQRPRHVGPDRQPIRGTRPGSRL
jgi:DNA polymerase-3 subunit gamma/tau